MAKGCFIFMNKKLIIKLIEISINWKITENSLIKILILGINDKKIFFFSEVLKKGIFIFDLQDQCFC